MDPRFEARPPASEIASALQLWPELAGKRVRPLFISAFGQIYLEIEAGDVWVADPLEPRCGPIAASPRALGEMFVDPEWADRQLLSDLVLLAEERGIKRAAHQVFAVAPHPSVAGELRVEHLVPMDLFSWHRIAAQLRRR